MMRRSGGERAPEWAARTRDVVAGVEKGVEADVTHHHGSSTTARQAHDLAELSTATESHRAAFPQNKPE